MRVDGSDFLRWQRGQLPSPRSQTDLNVWRVNFGQSILAASAMSPVPEFSTALLLLLGGALRRIDARDACNSRANSAERRNDIPIIRNIFTTSGIWPRRMRRFGAFVS